MNVNTQKMEEYAEFLEENSRKIIDLCNKLGESLVIAVQCMDQQSGRSAAQRMAQNLENIKKPVPQCSHIASSFDTVLDTKTGELC